MIVELDDRVVDAAATRKLERYDHFLAGWALHLRRYGDRAEATPIVVFVCRDRPRARRCAERADFALRACRAYAGEYPSDWQYPGRERIRFAAERDLHAGALAAYRVLPLPPEVRARVSGAGPHASEARALACSLLEPYAAADDVHASG